MGFNILQLIKTTPSYVSPYKSLYVARFQVDTEADLPAKEQTDYIIDLGSTAHVVDTNSEYAIKSNGTWVLQYEGTAAYTKAEIDTMLEDMQDDIDAELDLKQPLLTWDDVPTEDSTNPVYSKGIFYPMLTYINEKFIDIPGKNVLAPRTTGDVVVGNEVSFVINADGSATATVIAETTANRQLSWYATVPAGTWYFSTGQAQSGGSGKPCQAYLYTDQTIARDYTDQQFTLAEDTSLRCYIQIKKDVEQGTVFTFYPMVCKPIDYAMSNKYIQYTADRSLNQQQLRSSPDDFTIPSEEVVERDER